jgi:hypothetical protein
MRPPYFLHTHPKIWITGQFLRLRFLSLSLSQVSQPEQSRLRAIFSPARPSAPRRALNPSEGLPILYFSMLLFRGVAKAALYCAHRPSTTLPQPLHSSYHTLSEVAWAISTARLHRAPSERARWASKEMTRLPRISLHCQPLTSYPFSNKHRTTASPYGGSGSSGL